MRRRAFYHCVATTQVCTSPILVPHQYLQNCFPKAESRPRSPMIWPQNGRPNSTNICNRLSPLEALRRLVQSKTCQNCTPCCPWRAWADLVILSWRLQSSPSRRFRARRRLAKARKRSMTMRCATRGRLMLLKLLLEEPNGTWSFG
jgi:hypothetical protein